MLSITGAMYANPTGISFSYDVGGNDESKYKLLLIVYNGQAFLTTTDFKNKYNSNMLKKISPRPMLKTLINSKYGVEWAVSEKAPNPDGIKTGSGGATTRLNSNIVSPQVRFNY